MTYAPPTLTELARYWTSKGGVNLGVVGDTRHAAKGRSYHLGKSQLTPDAYSRKTARDRAGLSDAASAIDLGKLKGSYPNLRKFSVWLVKRCQSNAPGTQDIREVIYSPDGKTVLRWDRERGLASAPRPGEADNSHLGHTHVSFYRDSERRPKVAAFRPYFEVTPPKEAPVANPVIAAIAKRTEYLANEVAAGDTAGAEAQAAQIIKYASRFLIPDEPGDDGDFRLIDDPDAAFMQGGAAFGNPNGVSLTLGQAREVWEDIFAKGLNISRVRPTLLPGSFVLSPQGYAKAVELGKTSTNYAPEDYNPLGLEVIP